MKNKGRDATIRYAVTDSPLGRMLVAHTQTGLCAVAFGDTDTELERELRDRFPEATLVPAEAPRGEVASVLRHLEPDDSSTLPLLDLAGTPFEQRIWMAMTRIPRGTTLEYGQFAAELGIPNAARAVGAAIGKNPIALLFPCHRLVAKGGDLHRYRWGLDRKRWLLQHEGAPAQGDAQRELPLGG